ncbi:fructoselysine 6-kinase [Lachnotalea glycerini]|jgi:fructoselysine 6-kinase|uniref:Fructoselysine 6-kinase n=1 Tax=Lachnotalea glycerini TaxID=1763509 RepID=A0A371JKI1_9FIRM|nr:fructoselysine 6-kinase [Lachnotalea glycerini]RDY33244.1 fructoselysine 6-kinase [Lachnotalea glycerini]
MKFATVGDNCVDVYESLGKYYLGGNPVNVAVYLRRLGEEVSYTGVVGNDKNGELMKEALMEKGVDISHVKTLDGETAITKVEIINGDRVFKDYIEGVLHEFTLSEEDIDFLCSHELVITGIWGMIENDLPKMKERGIPIAFDFSDQPEHPIVEKVMDSVTYAFFSDDRGDTPQLREFMKKMQTKGPKLVLTTLGDKGSICYDGNQFYTQGIIPCEVVDTMGAGDSFIAGFLRAIHKGDGIEESMKQGAQSSYITIGYQGAW